MDIKVPKGKYVVAVSGGVDSMVLLDLLAKKPGLELVVAHFNHGMRSTSSRDEKLVARTAARFGMTYGVGYGHLRPEASEETARELRYGFLDEVVKKHRAKALITAHHQDDMVETAFINLHRGSGRRGLTAILSSPKVIRPLLDYPKSEILSYAKRHKISWHEDESNLQDKYLRNYLRKNILSRLTVTQRQDMIGYIEKIAKINKQCDSEIAKLSHSINQKNVINRGKFSLLPSSLGAELVVYWLRQMDLLNFDKRIIHRINLALRTYKAGSCCPVVSGVQLDISKKTAHFSTTI